MRQAVSGHDQALSSGIVESIAGSWFRVVL